MTEDEARAECQRWLDHLESQKAKAKALAELAQERRSGVADEQDARRRMAAINRGITVYDGARLAEAIETLLRKP